jgi:autotransporter-associated beta strand protein
MTLHANRGLRLGDSGGTFVSTVATTLSYAGTIAGTGNLTKAGLGKLTLSGSNTYSGGTSLELGTLSLGSSGAVGSSGTISFSGGALQSTSANTSDYSGRFSTAANQQYRIDTNGEDITLASALSSRGGSLTKLGSGSLNLAASNTFTGNTTIVSGTVRLTNANALGTSADGSSGTSEINVREGGALDINGLDVTRAADLSLTGAGVDDGGALRNGSTAAATYAGLITLNLDATISAANGDLSLTNTGTISGNRLRLVGGATGTLYGGLEVSVIAKDGAGTWSSQSRTRFRGKREGGGAGFREPLAIKIRPAQIRDISPKRTNTGGKPPRGQYGGSMELSLAKSPGPRSFGFDRSSPFTGLGKLKLILDPVILDSDGSSSNQDFGGDGQ